MALTCDGAPERRSLGNVDGRRAEVIMCPIVAELAGGYRMGISPRTCERCERVEMEMHRELAARALRVRVSSQWHLEDGQGRTRPGILGRLNLAESVERIRALAGEEAADEAILAGARRGMPVVIGDELIRRIHADE